MRSALEAHRNIKGVLGGDTIVVGAYRALEESGRLKDDMFLSGVDGDREALALIRKNRPYRLSIAFAWRLMATASAGSAPTGSTERRSRA